MAMVAEGTWCGYMSVDFGIAISVLLEIPRISVMICNSLRRAYLPQDQPCIQWNQGRWKALLCVSDHSVPFPSRTRDTRAAPQLVPISRCLE